VRRRRIGPLRVYKLRRSFEPKVTEAGVPDGKLLLESAMVATSLGVDAMRDGFPHAVVVGLGLVATFALAFFVIDVFGGFP